MEVNSGKSIQSLTSQSITLKHNTRTPAEYTTTHLNGSQFRQVYSITHITINHSQTQHENNQGMKHHQRQVMWEKACLVITLFEWEYSSTLMMAFCRMHQNPLEWKSIRASLVNHPHHNHSLSNTTREQWLNAFPPNSSDLREGMSSHHSLWMRILFNSNDGVL